MRNECFEAVVGKYVWPPTSYHSPREAAGTPATPHPPGPTTSADDGRSATGIRAVTCDEGGVTSEAGDPPAGATKCW